MDDLLTIVRSWSVRIRLQSSMYWMFTGLSFGLGASLILAVIARILPVFDTATLVVSTIVCALSAFISAIGWPWVRTRHNTLAIWARRFDQDFHLKERLSTALELYEGTINSKSEYMVRVQGNDALAIARQLNIRELLPLRIQPRFLVASLILALVLIFTITLPNPQQKILAHRAQMQQMAQEQIQRLEQIKQQIKQSSALTSEQRNQVVQALDEAQKALGDTNSTPEQALAALNDAQSKLDALHDQAAQDQRNDLQRAGQSLAPDPLTNPLANALENGDFRKAAEQIETLAKNNGNPLSNAERKRIADQLDQMARSVQNSNQATAQQLRAAAQNLRDQQDQAAQKALEQVAQMLNQSAQKQSAAQQVSQSEAGLDNARRMISTTAQEKDTAQTQQARDASAMANSQNGTGKPQGVNSQSAGAANQAQAASSWTGNSQANISAGNNGNGSGPGNNQHGEDTGTDSSVMIPGRVNDAGQNVVLSDDRGQSVADPNANANPGASNQSSVPYQQVYSQYAKTADDAIQSGSVPSDLRDYVHDYFSALNPRETR